MTLREFVRKLKEVADEQPRPVRAVDFEPTSTGLKLTFRFKD